VVSGKFSAIDWSAGPYFLKTEADPEGGDAYTLKGITQILSVPYSLYAQKAGNVFSGDYKDLSNAPAKVSYFDNDAGYLTREMDGDTTNEIQVLSISGDTLYLSNGGFVKLPPDGDFNRSGHFVTTLDSVGIGTDTPQSILDVHGRITQTGIGNSVIIGEKAGIHADTAGYYNVLIGYGSGENITKGSNNVAVGNIALLFNATGNRNVAVGAGSLRSNRADDNMAVGYYALFNNSTGTRNTMVGNYAGKNNTTGSNNTAMGYYSLVKNITGHENTAFGMYSLYWNRGGVYNTAVGYRTLYRNTYGGMNTALGYQALSGNTSGGNNTAMGSYALFKNAKGDYNTAVGDSALLNNKDAQYNSAFGANALRSNISGMKNTAVGRSSLQLNQSGSSNTAVGEAALYAYNDLSDNAGGNTAVGRGALRGLKTGSYNTAIGCVSGTYYSASFSNSTALGHYAVITASNQARIGSSSVISIGGYANWSNLSDGRFKTEVKSSVPGLSFIMKLRPVLYRLNVDKLNKFLNIPEDMQTKGVASEAGVMVRTGFIAQEVEKAAQETGYDFSGIDPPKNEHDFYNLRYAEFVVPLVQAIQEQQAEIEALKEQNKLLQQQIDALKNK